MKKKVLIVCLCLIFVCLILFLLWPPKFKFNNNEVLYNEKFKEKDIKITKFNKDYSKKVKVTGKVNTKKIGEYEITYKVKIGLITYSKKEIVKVIDKTKPVITLNGEEETYVCKNAEYKDAGAIAKDNYDGDITNKIKVNILEDKVIYTVKDSSNNKSKKIRKLIHSDITKPEITLNGDSTVYLNLYEAYQEKGVKAIDNCEGDISKDVKITGSVDTKKVGTYTLTYTVSDTSNNTNSISRNVIVREPNKNGVVYLTFDDGPMQGTTNVILDILKEENVKATFFVTKNGPDSLIKREFDEGHTVALHTYSHDYKTCYSSVDGYFNDLNQVQNRVKNITGVEAKIIRFPGGSSNTVSRRYAPGIMSTLSKEVTKRGYIYFDWNVSSGDAGATTSPTGVYNNVINGLRKNRANIVLMHDIKPYTRDAIRNIIKYGKQNGYSFDKITTNTRGYHQKINN